MDTRNKIVTPDDATLLLARSAGQVAVVAGFFDPLTVETAERFSRFDENTCVLAIVLDHQQSLLPAPVRALLVAALRSVSNVTIAQLSSWQSLLPPNYAGRLLFDPDADARQTQAFADLVLRKQAGR